MAQLLKLTELHDGLVASATDNDGQFLLIEAAMDLPVRNPIEFLPRCIRSDSAAMGQGWLKPETAENRVWLAGGQVHLVPAGPKGLADPVAATQAVAAVRASPAASCNEAISRPVLARVAPFAEGNSKCSAAFAGPPARVCVPRLTAAFCPSCAAGAADKQLHRARLYLPSALLGLLTVDPGAVAPAVEAFCSRDPIDLKACSKMAAFPPTTRAYGLVSFSRCLYAQVRRLHSPPPAAPSPHRPTSALG